MDCRCVIKQVALRAAEVLSKLGAFALKVLLDERSGETSSATKRARAVELRTILTRLGPTFVKIGQGLSTRPDLCPPEYLEELTELQVPCTFLTLPTVSHYSAIHA
jgi:aarF domain-containing kinase